MAQDGGSPARMSTVVVDIEILRNFQQPRFNPRNYNPTILETHGLGLSVAQLRATDSDEKVRTL